MNSIQKTFIPSDINSIQAEISINNTFDSKIFLICHPHPQYGGDMDNNVCRTIFRVFSRQKLNVARFNFRGVGDSSGKYSEGVGERQDVLNVSNYILSTHEFISKICIIGYSFGAAIGCSVINELPQFYSFVAISYPFTFIPQFIEAAHTTKPKLFITGDKDDFTSISDFTREYEIFEESKKSIIFKNVNHFWLTKEIELSQVILSWIRDNNV